MSTTLVQPGLPVLLTGAGADAALNPAPLNPSAQMTWTASPTGIVALSPVAGTNTCQVSYLSPGSAIVSAQDLNTAVPTPSTISGSISVTSQDVATQIIITAAPLPPSA